MSSLGKLHFVQGRDEQARPLLERALEVDPRHVHTLAILGKLHYEQGRHEEAQRLCKRALVVEPENRTLQRLQRLLNKLTGGIAGGPTVAAPPAVEIGAVVRVDGLATRPELNGSCGTVRSFDAEAGR